MVEHGQDQERGVLRRLLHLLQQVGAQAGELLVEAAEEEAAGRWRKVEEQEEGQRQEEERGEEG